MWSMTSYKAHLHVSYFSSTHGFLLQCNTWQVRPASLSNPRLKIVYSGSEMKRMRRRQREELRKYEQTNSQYFGHLVSIFIKAEADPEFIVLHRLTLTQYIMHTYTLPVDHQCLLALQHLSTVLHSPKWQEKSTNTTDIAYCILEYLSCHTALAHTADSWSLSFPFWSKCFSEEE